MRSLFKETRMSVYANTFVSCKRDPPTKCPLAGDLCVSNRCWESATRRRSNCIVRENRIRTRGGKFASGNFRETIERESTTISLVGAFTINGNSGFSLE